MKTWLGQEGGTQKIIFQTGKPLIFYLSVRTPLIGRRGWNLRLRLSGKTRPKFILSKLAKCWCGEVVEHNYDEFCPTGHSGEGLWWRMVG